MTIDYATYVRPELVLRDIHQDAKTLARILEAETSGVRDGDGAWHGCDALHVALTEITPRLAKLAELYVKASDLQRPPPCILQEPF